ncbi:MAG TPA: hypothetical protein VIL86_09215 [Tepidisphaeraceae bacterium]|jgi:hypothetical protein
MSRFQEPGKIRQQRLHLFGIEDGRGHLVRAGLGRNQPGIMLDERFHVAVRLGRGPLGRCALVMLRLPLRWCDLRAGGVVWLFFHDFILETEAA